MSMLPDNVAWTPGSITGAVRLRLARGQLPPMLLPAALVLLLAFGWGPNMAIVVCALLVLIVGSALLWRPQEPPILWFVFVYQWVEVSLLAFYANFKGLPLRAVDYYSDPSYATWLAMLGLLSLAIGVRLAAGPAGGRQAQPIEQQIACLPQIRLFKLYLGAVLLAAMAPLLANVVPGLLQPLLVSESLKWAAYVIFTIVSFRKKNASKGLWFLVFTFELLQGIGGYFSGFKFVFLYTFLGILTARHRFNPRQALGVIALTLAALFLGVVWSEVKSEYRHYVSGGKREQVVTVGYFERVGKLYELASELDGKGLQTGLDRLINRLAYISFFGAATHYVPTFRPHSDGAILFNALSRPFMPRLLFPDKSIIDESKLVRKYTGLNVAGMEEGVQVSLGFYGESYVDFGVYGMIFGLLGWGLFLGGAYRWLVHGRYSRGILGYGLATAVLMPAYGIGPSSAKLFGGIVTSLLVLYLFNRYFVPRYLWWLRLVNTRTLSSDNPRDVPLDQPAG